MQPTRSPARSATPTAAGSGRCRRADFASSEGGSYDRARRRRPRREESAADPGGGRRRRLRDRGADEHLLQPAGVVREDAHLLYGFGTDSERRAFRQLLKVNGVGARTALAVLSGMSVGELVEAVAAQETGRLVKVS